MDRRSLLKLAGIGAIVPVLSKADALRIEKGKEPKDKVERMPTATGRIHALQIGNDAWNKYNRIILEVELESTADTLEMLSQYRAGHFDVAVVPIIRG
jgi:hypothetical protein